ncbi:zinc finger, CCHC-type containing protein [Tanacetum coccineum]
MHAASSLENKKYFVTFIDDASRFCYVYLSHTKDEALDKFKIFKTDVELQQGSLIKRFRTDRGGEYMDTLYFYYVGIIHETNAPYTSPQNGISKRKNRVLKEMVNSMLSYSGLSQGFWGEVMLTACDLAVVRLPDPKLKTLGRRGIKCIFIGYVEHSKAFRFYVIEPNDSVSINSIIESRGAIFNENRFSSVPRPNLRIPNGTEDIDGSVVPEELYLIEGMRDEVSYQHSYCFNVEDDPKTFDEPMKSEDVAFWKEAINDKMDFIMGSNTWVLADLPPGCKPLGCKWIFKRKLKIDKTIEKFKARLVIQGFRQKSEIDYFDNYAPVVRISTIRLLIAMVSIHNLIIHQMDVKTAYLNGELEYETYHITLDLYPRLPDPGFTINCLRADAIGIYSEFLQFSGVCLNKVVSFEVVCRDLNIVPTITLFRVFQCLCKQGDWFSFSKRRNTEDVCMEDGPSSLNKWKDKFFLIDRRAIPNYLTWRHSCSCVLNDLPSDGYDRNDMQRLCARLIFFRRIDDNAEMSMYDFMTLPSWSDAKIVEESHHLSLPLLELVPSHTTTPALEGAIIPLPTLDEIAASLPDSRLVKKSKAPF